MTTLQTSPPSGGLSSPKTTRKSGGSDSALTRCGAPSPQSRLVGASYAPRVNDRFIGRSISAHRVHEREIRHGVSLYRRPVVPQRGPFRVGRRVVWNTVSCGIPLQVYHFTDVPSFRSGSSLCIFDPYARQAAHVPTSALAPSHICAGTGLAPCPHLRRD